MCKISNKIEKYEMKIVMIQAKIEILRMELDGQDRKVINKDLAELLEEILLSEGRGELI